MKVPPHFDTACAVLGADTAQAALNKKKQKQKAQLVIYVDPMINIIGDPQIL